MHVISKWVRERKRCIIGVVCHNTRCSLTPNMLCLQMRCVKAYPINVDPFSQEEEEEEDSDASFEDLEADRWLRNIHEILKRLLAIYLSDIRSLEEEIERRYENINRLLFQVSEIQREITVSRTNRNKKLANM